MNARLACSFALLTLLAIGGAALGSGDEEIGLPIPNPHFDFGGGEIPEQWNFEPCEQAPANVIRALGNSGWYAKSCPACLDQGGHFHPGIAVEDAQTGAGIAVIRRHPGGSDSRLGRCCESEAWMWAPLTGVSLEPDCNYTLSVDLDAGCAVDVAALVAQGFGIGVATRSTGTEYGAMFVDSLRLPSLVEITALKGTNQHLAIRFQTGAEVPRGDIAVVMFAARSPQSVTAAALQDYHLDNVALVRRRESGIRLGMTRPDTAEQVPDLPSSTQRITAALSPMSEASRNVPATPEPGCSVMLLTGAMIFGVHRPRVKRRR